MYRKLVITILLALAGLFRLPAQESSERVDSLVRLLSAQKMEIIDDHGNSLRKVTGPARFLHNDTFLICDTALWSVSKAEIEAIGNVRILQNETVLTGDKLTYYIDQDLAEFRGSVVQLEDKDHNMLRTRHLDYNTKDSVAVFQNGGALKDKDGQIIESITGTYDSKIKTFTFTDNVNMFTDSIFVKTTRLVYDTRSGVATFGHMTDAWRDENMLSSNAGWYDRPREVFLFYNNVHGLGETQEAWADSVYYHRNTNEIELLGNAQVTDTTRNVSALAGRIHYLDSTSTLTLTRDPAIVGITQEKDQPADTVYFGADSLVYKTVKRYEIPESTVSAAEKRLEDLGQDAIMTYRQKAAEAAAKAAEEAKKDDPNRPPVLDKKNLKDKDKGKDKDLVKDKDIEKDKKIESPSDNLNIQPTDSLNIPPTDSLALTDSLAVADSTVVEVPKDTTKIGFLTGLKNVRLFRNDIQIACDSLSYNDLDSLIRLYKEPIVWNEIKRQYAADSIYAVIRNNRMEKASLMSDAFIVIEEAPEIYDQIRSTEMLAYFDSTGALRRFDALGDANAVFYLKEDSTFATVNKAESKMLYATFVKGDIDRVYYFDQSKNDAYPLAQLRKDDRLLKGFSWVPEKRPVDPTAVTKLTLRSGEREKYTGRPRAKYRQTDIYYPGYMEGVYKRIAENEAAKKRREQEKATADSLAAAAAKDSLKTATDNLALTDSIAVSDSIKTNVADSLSTVVDSIASVKDTVAAPVLSPKEAARKAKEEARAAKIAAREAKWARLDSLDAAKAKIKAEKKAAKLRKKKLKELKALLRQQEKDRQRLEKYKAAFEAKKAREDAKKKKKEEQEQLPGDAELPAESVEHVDGHGVEVE